MKYILIIGDGMADNAVDALGDKTPLEATQKPHMDGLCAKGQLGSVLTVPKGLPPGSDTAILSIFGCDPTKYFTGRSPLEAAGCGITVAPGSISYRCNVIAMEDGEGEFSTKKILSHCAGSIEGDQSQDLMTWLMAEPTFKAAAEKIGLTIIPATSFRHITLQTGGDLDGFTVTPPHDILGQVVGNYKHAGCKTATDLWELMTLANQLLEHHPINVARRQAGKLPGNGIWFWAEGTAVALPNFYENYEKTGSVISAVPLVHGIGRLVGLKSCEVEGATGETETNYEGKVQAAVDCLASGDDFVCIHVEAPDEATHAGNLEEKMLSIGYLDRRVVKLLAEKMEGQDYRLLMLSDHKTLMSTRTHDGDPVPYMIYDSTKDTGCGYPYTEKFGLMGEYLDKGHDLMAKLFELGDKA